MTEEKKSGFHYGWLIFIGCCFLCASSMALTVSLMGVFILPGSQAVGCNPTEFSLWGTISGIVSTCTLPIYGQLLAKHTKLCYSIGSICLIAFLLSMSLACATQLYPLIIVNGILVGIQMPILFTLGVPGIMGQWFVGKMRGKFLGICMAFSGFGTFVWAPTFAIIINNIGVQSAYLVAACIAAVFTVPWTFFVFKWNPEDKGLKAIGWTPEYEAELAASNTAAAKGVSAMRALKTPAFWLVLIALALNSIGMGYNSSQTIIATNFIGDGMAAEDIALLGASMISAAAIGNIVGKIIFGIINDIIGTKPTMVIFIVLTAIGMLMWMYTPGTTTYLIAGFLFGTTNAVASVGFPLIVRGIFGDKDYAKIWSRMSMASALLGGSATTIVTGLATGTSWSVAIWLGIAFQLFTIVAMFIGYAASAKLSPDED